MSNMGYCRFRNTLNDLTDCQEHMGDTEEMSTEEKLARKRMIRLCKEIAEDYGDELE